MPLNQTPIQKLCQDVRERFIELEIEPDKHFGSGYDKFFLHSAIALKVDLPNGDSIVCVLQPTPACQNFMKALNYT